MDCNNHRFRGKCIALIRHAVDGNEDVGFGEVGGHAGAGDDGKLFGFARVAFVKATKSMRSSNWLLVPDWP